MRTVLTALTIGLTTLGTAAPALAQLPVPRINVTVGTPQPTYAQPTYVQPVPQPPQYGYGYNQPGYYRGGGPRWQDPQFFSFRVRDRMNHIQQDVRMGVQQGQISPQVFGAMHEQREHIENNLRGASMDGVITFDERQHILQDVDQMQQLENQFRGGYRPYGGGPWHQHNDDWR